MWKGCFLLSLLSRNFDDRWSSNFYRLVISCVCWDTASETTGLWQLPIVSTVFKKWPGSDKMKSKFATNANLIHGCIAVLTSNSTIFRFGGSVDRCNMRLTMPLFEEEAVNLFLPICLPSSSCCWGYPHHKTSDLTWFTVDLCFYQALP